MSETCNPESQDDAAGLIRDAVRSGKRFVLCGGRTRTLLSSGDVDILTSAGISGIMDYEPAEMVMIARAGTPMSEIESALDAGRQRLIFEPMDHRSLLGTRGEPTIGGVAAANVSGSRRFVAGAARDSLLGCRFINGSGEIIKAGGRVMKNVTGLDLVKLMAGSCGTLGLLTEVTFKVVPRVETEKTLVINALDPGRASEAMAVAMATANDVSGAAHLPATVAASFDSLDGDSTLLRLEGFEKAVAIRAEKLQTALSGFGEITQIADERSKIFWNAIRDCRPFADGSDDPVWRVSVPPSAGHTFAAAFPEGDIYFDWQGGLVWLRLKGDPQAPKVRSMVAGCVGGHATLVRASPAVLAQAAVRHPEPEPISALSERIRKTFDPQGIFIDPGQPQ